MEAFVCQVTEATNDEINAEAPIRDDSISTLSSVEMSFVGGGGLAVDFN